MSDVMFEWDNAYDQGLPTMRLFSVWRFGNPFFPRGYIADYILPDTFYPYYRVMATMQTPEGTLGMWDYIPRKIVDELGRDYVEHVIEKELKIKHLTACSNKRIIRATE